MKKLKFLSVLLTAALLCSLFSGCMAVIADTTVNADGSGSITMSMGTAESMMSEEEKQEAKEDPEQVAFEYNGKTYYGTVETLKFDSLDELNGDTEKYLKNPDGSWTLWYNITSEELDDNSDAAMSDADTEMAQELVDVMMQDLAIVETIRMPDALTAIGGSTVGTTISGGTLTIDVFKAMNEGAYGIRTFTTAKKLPTFSDVGAGKWYTPAITTLALGGLVDGMGSGLFAPENKLTVAQFCQMVTRAAGGAIGADESGYWAAKAVKACLSVGIVADRGEVTAKNYDVAITREEAIAGMTLLMVGPVDENVAAELPDEEVIAEVKAAIPDYDQISEQYRDLIVCAYANGITSGMDAAGTFQPKGELTRAQMCQLFYNVGVATAG